MPATDFQGATITDAHNGYKFEIWNGQLIRPQKVLDIINRLGTTGSTVQIVFTKGPDCLISAKYLADEEVNSDFQAFMDFQGTIVNIVDDRGQTYERVLCKAVTGITRAIPTTEYAGGSYRWLIELQLVLEVQPEDSGNG